MAEHPLRVPEVPTAAVATRTEYHITAATIRGYNEKGLQNQKLGPANYAALSSPLVLATEFEEKELYHFQKNGFTTKGVHYPGLHQFF